MIRKRIQRERHGNARCSGENLFLEMRGTEVRFIEYAALAGVFQFVMDQTGRSGNGARVLVSLGVTSASDPCNRKDSYRESTPRLTEEPMFHALK